jgi:hypothetical protein
MIGRHRSADARHAQQGGETGILLMAGGDQPLHHIGAVQSLERNDVTDRRERHEIEPGEQVERSGTAVALLPEQRSVATSTRKTTPAAQRCPCPDRSSSRFGLTSA